MQELVFRFTQKWWAVNYGLNFSQRYYTDPIWRVACHQEMQDILLRELPDVPSRCFVLLPAGVGVGLQPVNILMGVCGSTISYPENQDPWAQGPILHTEEEIDAFEPPDLEGSAFLADMVGQFDRLAQEYPPAEIEAYGQGNNVTLHSSLVCAHKLAGEEVFVLMHKRPDLMRTFLTKLTALNEALIDFWACKRGARIDDITIGDCSATLLSPGLYRQFSLPCNGHTIQRYNVPYGIHSCGPSTHVLDSLVGTPGAAWCEVGWYAQSGHTDLAKARQILIERGCPKIRVLLNPGDVIQWDEREMRDIVGRIVETVQPLDLVVRSILGVGVTLKKVRALYDAVERG